MTRGIDTSYWDGELDWKLYTWDFAFIKVSEGTVPDPTFIPQWTNARNNTIRGPYHYFRSFVDPKEAAQKVFNIIESDIGELPLALDLEKTDGRPDVIDRALTFQNRYKQLSGDYPIIYTSPSFIFENKIERYPEFEDFLLWLAAYPYDNYSVDLRKKIIKEVLDGDRQLHVPTDIKPFKLSNFVFYQWTGKGNPEDVPGYVNQRNKLAVDFDLFNGTIDQMKMRFQIKNPTEDPMPDITLTAHLKEGYTSNVREEPNIAPTTRILENIKGPLDIQGIGKKTVRDGYEWIQIVSPRSGYVALTDHYENINYTDPGHIALVTTIAVINPQKVIISFDDGTQITYPE